MNEEQFFNELRFKLKEYPKNDIDDLIFEFKTQVDEEVKSGINREDAFKNLGTVDQIVESYVEELGVPDFNQSDDVYNKKNETNNILNTNNHNLKIIAIQIFNVFIILPLLLFLFGILSAILLSSIIISIFFLMIIKLTLLNIIYFLLIILCTLFFIFLCSLAITYYLSKYIKYNILLIKGEVK